jgi:hypothetical protein
MNLMNRMEWNEMKLSNLVWIFQNREMEWNGM